MVLRAPAHSQERPSGRTWAAIRLRAPRSRAALASLVLAAAATSTPGVRAQAPSGDPRYADRAAAAEPAGEEKDEVLIGTFALKPKPAPVPPPLPGTPAGNAPPAAADVYADALRLLQAGDQAGGQRQLEQLVARFPSSAEARLARLRLARLYADPERPETSASSAANEAATASEAEGWSAEVRARAARADEDQFRMEVGDRVFFVSGSADLGSRARSVLAAQAAWLQKQPQVDVLVEGHSDDPGGTEENRSLAQARAEAVRQRLVEEGISPERLRVVALGRSRRIAECDGAECATHNRRAVTVVYPRGSEPPGARFGASVRGGGSRLSADLPRREHR